MSFEYEGDASGKAPLPTFHYYTDVVHHEPYERISPSKPAHSAREKNVVVTGGGTGIGKAIAISFAQAGARSISILGRREDRLKAAVAEIFNASTDSASNVIYESVDLMKREQVDAALASIVSKVGKLDILVSNAAGLPYWGPLLGHDAEEFMRGFELNVLSGYNAVQAFVPLAVARPTIINISTALAHMAPMQDSSGYGITKAAQLKMMDYFAAENPHLHLVNVQPGGVDTELSAQAGIHGPDSRKCS